MMKEDNAGTSVVGDVQERQRNKRKLEQDNNRGSPIKLVKLYAHMSDYQRQLIYGDGFGGLLNCGCSQMFPDLCQWLLDRFEAESSEIFLNEHSNLSYKQNMQFSTFFLFPDANMTHTTYRHVYSGS